MQTDNCNSRHSHTLRLALPASTSLSITALQQSSAASDSVTSRLLTVGKASNSSSSRKSFKSSGDGKGNGNARFNFTKKGFSIGAFGGGGGAIAWFGGARVAHASPLWPLTSSAGTRKGKDGKPRVLILMSDTGGGHRASAEAIKGGFDELYGAGKYHVDIIDIWTLHTPWPFNQLPKSYSFMVKYPFIWRANFTTTQPRFVHVPLTVATGAIVGRHISEAYDIYKPNLVVSVHPLMQHVPVRILRQRIKSGIQKQTNFATVVTDLTTCHNTWFYSGVDRCFVATQETKDQALSLGLTEDQIRLYGLPIRPSFSRKYPAKDKLRHSLGMDPHKPAVLLCSGGEGMGPVEKTVDGLASSLGADCQVVVVCGRNAKLVEKLSSKPYPKGMHVLVKGFVDNMPEFMNASDVIITKAGPGTISEALICGLPMVLNAFVPCQEEGNIPYVTHNHVGVFESKPKKIAAAIKDWFANDKSELNFMAKRAKALGKPHALLDICRDLQGMVLT